jgi:hypothetical protein
MGHLGGIGTIVRSTIALAGPDVVESVPAKKWSVRRNHWLLLAGTGRAGA